MLANSQGIVLRTVKYSETSVICDVYTSQWGMRAYIINGVRQQTPSIAPLLLRPCSLIDFVAYHHPEKALNRLKEAKAGLVYQHIPFSVLHGSVALFAAELLQKLLKEQPASAALFQFLYEYFRDLDQCKEGLANMPLLLMGQLSVHLGFAPALDTYQPDAYFDYKNGLFDKEKPLHLQHFEQDCSQALVDVCCTPTAQSHSLQLEKGLRTRLLSSLLDYYSFHLSGFSELQSHKVLQTIF